jgi:hypothetical protein
MKKSALLVRSFPAMFAAALVVAEFLIAPELAVAQV